MGWYYIFRFHCLNIGYRILNDLRLRVGEMNPPRIVILKRMRDFMVAWKEVIMQDGSEGQSICYNC
jgi:hypothetical protein